MELRLSHIMSTLPKYETNHTKGPYKNGNYKGIFIVVDSDVYDANKFPREFLERPYYVKRLAPFIRSAYGSKGSAGLYIILDREENNYV